MYSIVNCRLSIVMYSKGLTAYTLAHQISVKSCLVLQVLSVMVPLADGESEEEELLPSRRTSSSHRSGSRGLIYTSSSCGTWSAALSLCFLYWPGEGNWSLFSNNAFLAAPALMAGV